MDRREFGRRVFEVGAALGLRSLGAGPLGALGLSLSACGETSDPTTLVAEDQIASQQVAVPCATPDGKSVIIIGSGYGSAVAALRLTERGIPVTILEMGRLWNKPGPDGKVFCTPFQPDGRAMWFKDELEAVIKQIKFLGIPIPISIPTPKQAGVLHISGPENMRVSRGRGVGGGSLVNMAILVTPEREVLRKTFPGVDVDSMLSTYYPRAKKHLGATQVPEDLVREEIYRYSRVAVNAATQAGYPTERLTSGYDYDYMRQELQGKVPKSATDGEGGFGNNYGKRSLDKTYLAEAMGTGLLTVLSMHEVKRIKPRPSGGYVLNVQEIDIDGKVLAQKEMPCTHVFVGAGSMDTSDLLVSSRERGDLPDLNMAVGTQWGPNSDIFVALNTPLWAPTGSTQCTVPSSGFRTTDPDGRRALTMIIPFPMGFESFVSFHIVMTESPEAGHFVYNRETDSAELKWAPEQSAIAVATTRRIFDPINVKNGSSYNEGLFGGPTIGDRSTYHPVGGVPLGRATDAYGRITAYPGLYVVDGSLIPIGIGANPALTVAALAERNVEQILKEDFRV